jgi:hypothetical protein
MAAGGPSAYLRDVVCTARARKPPVSGCLCLFGSFKSRLLLPPTLIGANNPAPAQVYYYNIDDASCDPACSWRGSPPDLCQRLWC